MGLTNMKYDFTYYNPTRVHFGKDAMQHLPEELEQYGDKVLLLYGKNSIKSIGLYDEIVNILQECGKTIVEVSGIKSNPSYSQVLQGAQLVKENNVDLILAVGGGSVIDCAKAISVSAYADGDPWQRYWVNAEPVNNPIVPVGTILTMAGTGSEMNGGSVITNEDITVKKGRVYPPAVYPKFSIMNPEYTYSVPKIQMVSGVFDIMSHLMEQYFSGDDDNTTDYMIEGIMISLIESAKKALINPNDYEARGNIMWCATVALNTITGLSKTQDWKVHHIEHQVGAYTDCPHGLGLAVVSIPYYKYIYQDGLDKFVRFAERIWNVVPSGKTKETIALEGIDALQNFIIELGIPTTLRELGVTNDMLPKIAYSIAPGGGYRQISQDEIYEILKACY